MAILKVGATDSGFYTNEKENEFMVAQQAYMTMSEQLLDLKDLLTSIKIGK